MNEPNSAPAGALAGLKVIDLSRVLGGPYCTMILGDHGADVIKIEPPQGDETRDWGPPFSTGADGNPTAAYFTGVNRNKRGMALDLGKAEGRNVLLRLLADADVLIENFKPGAMEKWGLGYDDVLAARFPRLIHCRVSGFGADGPLGGLPGYDAVVQAMAGLMSVNGDAGTGPMRIGIPLIDIATGLYSATAILMALQERQRSNMGQFIDMTLHDCGIALAHPAAAAYLASGKRPAATGNVHPNFAPYEKYATRSYDVFIASGNNGQFRKLTALLGRPELAADPRFKTNASRVANRAEMMAELAAIFAVLDGKTIADSLIRGGVPAGAVLSLDDVLASPHVAHREMVVRDDDYQAVFTPIKFSRSKARLRHRPPDFSDATNSILKSYGYSDEEIYSLEATGITPYRRQTV
jgi:formyl-CoA transferase